MHIKNHTQIRSGNMCKHCLEENIYDNVLPQRKPVSAQET